MFGLTERKLKLKAELPGNETSQGMKKTEIWAIESSVREQSTHVCAQNLRTMHHLSWGPLPIQPSLISLGAASLRRGRWKDRRWAWGWEGIPTCKPRQLELYCVLLPCEWTEKEKVMACANMQTLLKLTPFDWASSVDAFNSQAFRPLRHKCSPKSLRISTLLHWTVATGLQQGSESGEVSKNRVPVRLADTNRRKNTKRK